MKSENIKEYETGEHCFGPILTINGKDFDDIPPKELIEFVNDMLENDINKISLLREIVENCVDYLQFDIVESNYHTCEQCGNPNNYVKFKREDENKN